HHVRGGNRRLGTVRASRALEQRALGCSDLDDLCHPEVLRGIWESDASEIPGSPAARVPVYLGMTAARCRYIRTRSALSDHPQLLRMADVVWLTHVFARGTLKVVEVLPQRRLIELREELRTHRGVELPDF